LQGSFLSGEDSLMVPVATRFQGGQTDRILEHGDSIRVALDADLDGGTPDDVWDFFFNFGPELMVNDVTPGTNNGIRDGVTFTLSTPAPASETYTFEFETGPVLQVGFSGNLGDGQWFELFDGTNTQRFEFDSNDDVTPGAIPVAFAGFTQNQLLTEIVTKINQVPASLLDVTAVAAGNRITLVGDVNPGTGILSVDPSLGTGLTVSGDYTVSDPVSRFYVVQVEETADAVAIASAMANAATGAGLLVSGAAGHRVNFADAEFANFAGLLPSGRFQVLRSAGDPTATDPAAINIAANYNATQVRDAVRVGINAAIGAGTAVNRGGSTNQVLLNVAGYSFDPAGTHDLEDGGPMYIVRTVYGVPFDAGPPVQLAGSTRTFGVGPGYDVNRPAERRFTDPSNFPDAWLSQVNKSAITGVAFLGNQLYAVDDRGGLYRVVTSGGGSFTPTADPRFNQHRLEYIASSATDLIGIQFAGLEAGPRNVENGQLREYAVRYFLGRSALRVQHFGPIAADLCRRALVGQHGAEQRARSGLFQPEHESLAPRRRR
jgi:hypothetical protein